MAILSKNSDKLIRYAVIGLGYIAQNAILPAFAKCDNCKLTALVSDDKLKLKELAESYNIEHTYSYDEYETCLKSGFVDAVCISLPNSMHCEYTLSAAENGIHVFCEKPMAVTTEECLKMINTCKACDVELMIGYRLHFESVNLDTIKAIREGRIGRPKFVLAAFAQHIKSGDIRKNPALGGGAMYDMGIYCLNAARYFFGKEPIRVTAIISDEEDKNFEGVDTLTGVILDFGEGQIANFVTSFASANISSCIVVGEKGTITLDPAFDYQKELVATVKVDDEIIDTFNAKTDQFAGELKSFANAIINDEEVRPSGIEGLADIKIIEAIYESAITGKTIFLDNTLPTLQPDPVDKKEFDYTDPPELVNASSPSGE